MTIKEIKNVTRAKVKRYRKLIECSTYKKTLDKSVKKVVTYNEVLKANLYVFFILFCINLQTYNQRL